jgi:hypothetical protein
MLKNGNINNRDMSITVKTRTWVIAILIAIGGIFFLGWYLGHKKANRALNALISSQNATINRYVVKIGGDSVYIAEKEQEILTKKQAIKNGELEREELRKLNLKQANELTRLQLRIDTLLTNVTHNGQIIEILNSQIANYKPANDTITKQKAILLPFSFEKKDEWLNLAGNFNNQGKLDISLKLDVPLDIWTGVDKLTKLPIAKVSTKCPYLGILSINSIKMDTKKPTRYGIGVFMGYGLNLTGTIKASPLIGVGIQYSIIRF